MVRVPALFLCVLVVIAACSSTNGSSGSTCSGTPPLMCDGCCGAKYAADECVDGAWACAPRSVACVLCDAGTGDSGVGDASGDAGCLGNPPACSNCCGNPITVLCESGHWVCPAVACPICSLGDAAPDAPSDSAATDATSDDAAGCAGTAPLCFGNDSTRCCGNDPAGRATCSAGRWVCGSAPAPGCNGQSCVLISDAGPG